MQNMTPKYEDQALRRFNVEMWLRTPLHCVECDSLRWTRSIAIHCLEELRWYKEAFTDSVQNTLMAGKITTIENMLRVRLRNMKRE